MKLFDDRRTRKRKIGDEGENIASEYLAQKGYRILERNWTHGKNEVDIIALDSQTVVFVEVKTTHSDKAESFKLPSEAVDGKKQQNLTDCAREYISQRKAMFDYPDEYYRFDVIEVYLNRQTPEINHIEDAFYAKKGNTKQWKT